LQIVPNAMVTRVIFSNSSAPGNLTASAVEYASARNAPKKKITVRKEVLLAGGSVGSPSILMHSGVGPKDVLQTAGVQLLAELPGVGQHLQDHLSTQIVYKTSSQTVAAKHSSNSFSSVPGGSSAFLSFINSATAYINITTLLGSSAQSFQSTVSSALESSVSSLVPSQDPTVIEGYRAIYNVSAQQLLMTSLGHIEILLSTTGTAVGGDKSVAVQVALQRPFSQGYLYIASADPFDDPIIDPKYLSHSADATLLREGLKLARKIAQTAPLSATLTGEVSPGSGVNTDDEWDAFAAQTVGTEFHPSCTCAMLPLNQGGVVDADLRVYGLSNVRVVDGSVFPIQFATHLSAPVYGLAEQAANMIRTHYNLPPPTNSSATPQNNPQSQNEPSGASRSHPSGLVPLLCAVALLLLSYFV